MDLSPEDKEARTTLFIADFRARKGHSDIADLYLQWLKTGGGNAPHVVLLELISHCFRALSSGVELFHLVFGSKSDLTSSDDLDTEAKGLALE